MREPTKSSPPSNPILYFDAAPVRTAEEVGGFGTARNRRRGLLAAATLTESGELRLFKGDQCKELAAHLESASGVVGYNCLRFDYELIRGQTPFRHPPTTDLMIILRQMENRHYSFDNAVRKYLGCCPAPGLEAVHGAATAADWTTAGLLLKQRLGQFALLHRKLGADFPISDPLPNQQ